MHPAKFAFVLCSVLSMLAMPLAAQPACPAIDFINIRNVSMLGSGTMTTVVREPDGSYTGYPHRTSPPHARQPGIAGFQKHFTNCLPPALTRSAGIRVDGRPQGMASVPVLAIPDVGNGTSVGVWIAFTGTSVLVYQHNPDYSYKSRTDYPVGANRSGLLWGDYTGDGKPDIAVLGTGAPPGNAGFVAVLSGNGDGTFQQAVNSPSGAALPVSMAQGDYNGDNRLDLAVLQGDNRTDILLGNGDGTFRAGASHTVQFPSSVASADLNGDGRPDLAVANRNSNGVSILLGRGDGTFGAATDFPVGVPLAYVATGDFNKDSRLDLALAGRNGTVSVLLGGGNGTFQAVRSYVVSLDPETLILADFDQDGNLDIIAGDGIPEAMVPTEDVGYFSVLLGRGDGTFIGAPVYAGGGSPAALAAGDFDGDGSPDLALANWTGSVSVLTATASGGFQAAAEIPLIHPNGSSGPDAIAASDINGDGRIDLAVVGNANPSLWLLMGNGDGTFQAPSRTALPDDGWDVAVADFNGDGRRDVAVAVSASGTEGVWVALQQVGGGFSPQPLMNVGPVPKRLAARDLNGDGRQDLIVVNAGVAGSGGGSVAILEGKGDGTFQAPVQLSAGDNPSSIALGDLNKDGRTDLVVTTTTASFTSRLAILLGGSGLSFQPASLLTTDFGPNAVGISDFSGDGIADLVVSHCCGQTDMTYLLGKGDGTFEPEVHFFGGGDTTALHTADLNRDGRADLLTALGGGGTGGGVAVLMNNTGDATPTTVPAAGFERGPVAPESIVAVFGNGLAAGTESAEALPLPLSLAGTSVSVTDTAGTQRGGPLFFVSPRQVNFEIPAGTVPGTATVRIHAPGGVTQAGAVDVAAVAPAIFTLNAGRLGAAQITRALPGGGQAFEAVFQVDGGEVKPLPINFGPETDRLFLVVYATGVRGRSDNSAVQLTVGGTALPVEYAGPQGTLEGLDQINAELPRALAGRGQVEMFLTADGRRSNSVTLVFQ